MGYWRLVRLYSLVKMCIRDSKRVVGFVMPVLDTQRTIELEYILQARQAKAHHLPEGIGAKVSLACNLATLDVYKRQARIC